MCRGEEEVAPRVPVEEDPGVRRGRGGAGVVEEEWWAPVVREKEAVPRAVEEEEEEPDAGQGGVVSRGGAGSFCRERE